MLQTFIKNNPSYVFLLTLILILSFVYFITGMHPNHYKDNPVNFSKLTKNQYALTSSLIDADIAEIKLDYINNSAPPKIGLYGHHVIKGMGQNAFDENISSDDFFNFWFDHISLIELRDLLLQLEASNKLPKELILIYISHPYLGLSFLTEYRWEMPAHFYNNFKVLKIGEIYEKGQHIFNQVNKSLSLRLDWKHVGYSFIKSLFNFCRIHGIYDKSQNVNKIELPEVITSLNNYGLSFLTNRIKRAFDAECTIKNIRGLSNDGSHYGPYDKVLKEFYEDPEVSGIFTDRVMSELSLLIEEINNIGKRNDKRVVFFIPPRMQNFYPNSGHEQFDKKIIDLKSKGIEVIDHRIKQQKMELFYDRVHVNDKYFRLLLKELKL